MPTVAEPKSSWTSFGHGMGRFRTAATKIRDTLRAAPKKRSPKSAPSFYEKLPDPPDDFSDRSTLIDNSIPVVPYNNQELPAFDRPKSTFTFSLLRGLAGVMSRSHPSFKDSIILHSLKILRNEVPLSECDFDAVDVFINLLELIRPNEYDTRIRKEALSLLLTQIQSDDSRLLAEVISDVPYSDICEILAELLACLPHPWMETQRQEIHFSLQGLLRSASPSNQHPAAPFVRFLLHLSRQSSLAARAVVEMKFLDLVLCICISESTSYHDPRFAVLLDLCLDVLSALAAHANNHPTMISRYSLLREHWPSRDLQDFDESYFSCVISEHLHNQTSDARMNSGILEKPFAFRKLSARATTSNNCEATCETFMHVFTTYSDESDVKSVLAVALSTYLSSRNLRKQKWTALKGHLLQTPYIVVTRLLFALISDLLANSSPAFRSVKRPPSLDKGAKQSKVLKIKAAPSPLSISTFLDFAQFSAGDSMTLRTAFVEAGILAFQPHRDQEFWRQFHYLPLVPKDLRAEVVRVLDGEPEDGETRRLEVVCREEMNE